MKMKSFKAAYQVSRLEIHDNIVDCKVTVDANGVKHVSKRAYMMFKEADGSEKTADLFGCRKSGATISEPLTIDLVENAMVNGKLDGQKASEVLANAVIDIQVDETTGEFYPLIKRASSATGTEVGASW